MAEWKSAKWFLIVNKSNWLAFSRALICAHKCAHESCGYRPHLAILFASALALLAAPASAATVALDGGTSAISWGGDRSLTGAGGYRVTAEGRDELQKDGSTLIGEFGFFNDTIAGTGHSRSFEGSITDDALSFSFTLSIDTTWNRPLPLSDTPDAWLLSIDLPEGYRLAYDRWLVPEGQWGHAWIYRDAEITPPAPVPLPAAGGLLAAALAWLGLRKRPTSEYEPRDGGWAESRAARNAPLDDHDIEELLRDPEARK